MPDFEITAPDGRRFTVTAPEGATQEQVLSYAQQNAPPVSAAPERSAGDQAARLAGNMGAGANRALARVVGGPFDLVNRGLRAVGVPIPQGSVTDSIQRGFDNTVGAPPQPENALERAAQGVGSGVVDAGSFLLPATVLSRTAQAGGLIQGMAASAAANPLMQMASGVMGGAVGEATQNPLLGTAAAVATPLAASVLGRMITPIRSSLNPARAELVDAAQRERIPLSTGQYTGSRVLQNMEASMAQLPGTAGSEQAFRQTQTEAFNRAALSRAGEGGTSAAPEILTAAQNRIGGEIRDIASRNTMNVTPQLQTQLSEIQAGLRFIPAEASAPVGARIEQLRGMMVQPEVAGGAVTIPGASYRMMDSQLGRSIRGTSNGDLRTQLGNLRHTLRAAMDESITPQESTAWQQLRREYANLMVIAQATKGAGASTAEGNVSPLALRAAVDASTGGGYAFGRGSLNQLARVGQSILRPVPDSFTAGRSFMNGLLTMSGPSSGGAIGAAIGGIPGAAIGAAAGLAAPAVVRGIYTAPMVERYLRNEIMSPQLMGSIGNFRNNVMMQQALRAATEQPSPARSSP